MPALNQLSKEYQERLISTIPIQSYKLDSLSFELGQLIIVGSRPGMGKSTFLMFMLQTFFEQCSIELNQTIMSTKRHQNRSLFDAENQRTKKTFIS